MGGIRFIFGGSLYFDFKMISHDCMDVSSTILQQYLSIFRCLKIHSGDFVPFNFSNVSNLFDTTLPQLKHRIGAIILLLLNIN